MISDESAYQKALSGDNASAALLVERYGDALTLFLNGSLGNLHDAEDLMLEAFSLLLCKRRSISSPGSFRAYLFKTARNLALRHLHKHRLHPLSLDELPFDPADEILADTALLQDERHRQLYAALLRLKPEYREALYLVYFQQLRYRDAAAILGKSEQQVTKLIYHGKQQLKALLLQEGFVYADV